MRLQAISLGTPDGAVSLSFHREMTVVSGLDGDERAELAAHLLGAMIGEDPAAEAVCTSFDGQPHTISRRGGATPIHEWRVLGNVVTDATQLWRLSLVGRESFVAGDARLEEPPLLIEARRGLLLLEHELRGLQRADVAAPPEEVRRVAEKIATMSRRLNDLNASLNSGRRSRDRDALASAATALQARFTAAGSLGVHNERLPMVFDDAFADADASRKWDLLDLVRRLATHNQVIYLTDDPFVSAWARKAVEDGRIHLIAAGASESVSV